MNRRTSPLSLHTSPTGRLALGLALGVGLAGAGSALFADDSTFGAYAARGSTITEDPVPELHHPDVQEGIQGLQQFSMAFSAVASSVRPSVVSIQVEKTVNQSFSLFGGGMGGPLEDFFGPQGGRQVPVHGGGTGIIVTGDGYILTNNHVVDGAERITVRLADGREFQGTTRGADPKTDLAVVDIDAHDLTPAHLGRSADVRVGEWVVAIGHPYNLDYTVTAGIVSAKGRSNLTNLVQYQDFIQTDASINPGNSGGPLVNLNGEVIGINTLIDGRGAGLGFSIPSDMASQIMGQLIASGKVVRPWLGVRIQDVGDPIAEAVGYRGKGGAFVVAVEDASPAAQAGLLPEDIIVAVDGAPIDSSNDLVNTVVTKQVGQDVGIDVFRDGRQRTLTVHTAAMPEDGAQASADAAEGGHSASLGLDAREVTPQIAQELGLPDTSGVVVWAVDPMGPAARAGLRRGDVILEAGRAPVASPSDLSDAVDGAEADAVLLKVFRGGAVTYLAMELS